MKVRYSPEFPRLLSNLKCTLAVSTYQSGMVILVSSLDGKHITQFGKRFNRPMGIAVSSDNRVAIACKNTVEVFGTHRKLALSYKKKVKTYDGMFFPRATYYTGPLDLHDIVWNRNQLISVNTAFSCLVKITDSRNFEVLWKPSFITELLPEDRCHLNGLTVNNENRYVTLFANSNEKKGWKKTGFDKGLLMDINDELILADQLPIPHSPRVIGNKLFFLLSATGEVHFYDLINKTIHFFTKIAGFVRGMNAKDDFLFVGVSTIRKESDSFGILPVSKESKQAGIIVYKISTAEKVAELFYEEKVTEIFEVAVVPNLIQAVILDKSGKIHSRAINVSEDIFFWKKEEK